MKYINIAWWILVFVVLCYMWLKKPPLPNGSKHGKTKFIIFNDSPHLWRAIVTALTLLLIGLAALDFLRG